MRPWHSKPTPVQPQEPQAPIESDVFPEVGNHCMVSRNSLANRHLSGGDLCQDSPGVSEIPLLTSGAIIGDLFYIGLVFD